MRIALDVHGGDVGVARNISAALGVAGDPGLCLVLVGHTTAIEAELQRRRVAPSRFEQVHAEEQIGMDESAVQSVRRKSDNSITVALELLKEGAVDAVVSAGHSGAVVAAALMTVGRISNVARPALGTRIPAAGRPAFVLDIGAVIDPKPEMLLQFGYLGSAYAQSVLGIEAPTVALLSNGEEPSKGNALVRAARELLERSSLDFVGYIESHQVFENPPAVVVTDGFTGNIALKTAEATASGIQQLIRRELTSSWRTKLPAALLRPAFRRIRDEIDFEGIGGVPLLGVNGVVVIAHGRSTPRVLGNAIRHAARAAEVGLPDLLRQAMPDTDQTEEAVVSPVVKVSD
jgi:glycerol-3-phosphate acyltransferase PlsX